MLEKIKIPWSKGEKSLFYLKIKRIAPNTHWGNHKTWPSMPKYEDWLKI
jgi:hypothetical protein